MTNVEALDAFKAGVELIEKLELSKIDYGLDVRPSQFMHEDIPDWDKFLHKLKPYLKFEQIDKKPEQLLNLIIEAGTELNIDSQLLTQIKEKVESTFDEVPNTSSLAQEQLDILIKFIDVAKNWEMIEHYGGMDQGSDYWTVWYFPTYDIHISFNGWYARHHGAEYEEMSLVVRKQVIKADWVPVK